MAETKNTQTGSGSSPARAGVFGNKNREQGRRGTAVGGGNSGRNRGGSAATTAANPPRQPLPLSGAGGRRGRGNPINFVRDVRSELRKVAWPTKKEVINSTIIVLIAVVVMTTLIFGFDYASAKFVLFLFD